MKAVGEYLIVQLPEKKQTEGSIELPQQMAQNFSYGKVSSVGDLTTIDIGPGRFVTFDPQGAIPIALDPLRPESRMIVLHQEQVFAEIEQKELETMGLPIPE